MSSILNVLEEQREVIVEKLKEINKKIEDFYDTKIDKTFYKSTNDNMFYFIYEHKNSIIKCLILNIEDNTIEKEIILPADFKELQESSKEEFVVKLITITLNIQTEINEILKA